MSFAVPGLERWRWPGEAEATRESEAQKNAIARDTWEHEYVEEQRVRIIATRMFGNGDVSETCQECQVW